MLYGGDILPRFLFCIDPSRHLLPPIIRIWDLCSCLLDVCVCLCRTGIDLSSLRFNCNPLLFILINSGPLWHLPSLLFCGFLLRGAVLRVVWVNKQWSNNLPKPFFIVFLFFYLCFRSLYRCGTLQESLLCIFQGRVFFYFTCRSAKFLTWNLLNIWQVDNHMSNFPSGWHW